MSEGFPGIAHVAITVTDLDRSVPWYQTLFGAGPVLDQDTGPFRHVVWATSTGTLVSLHKFDSGTDPKDRMDERRVGLDHIGFGVETRQDLENWAKRLDELGIAHGDIVDADYGSGLSFRDPDNNALEFFANPGT